MYLASFGFREKPFNLTPDPKFLYLNASYREALASLHYGIAERKGFVALIGEAGTGKTTLLRRLLSELGPETRSVLVLNPSVGFDDLLGFILTDLGRPPAPGTPKLEMLEALNAELLDTLARGGNVVVLIDEAQDLGIGVLEELRLLSNLETAKEKILQFVLAGQPELDVMLERRELRQLRQRIAVFARLRALARRELEAYVAARIEAAGGSANDLFSRPALFRLWRFSGGVPRLVNVAGDNALVTAYAAGRRRVGWRAVGEAVADLRPSRGAGARRRRVSAAAIGLAAVLGITFGLLVSRMTGHHIVVVPGSAPRSPLSESAASDVAVPPAREPVAAEAAAPAAHGLDAVEAAAPVVPDRLAEEPRAAAAEAPSAAMNAPADAVREGAPADSTDGPGDHMRDGNIAATEHGSEAAPLAPTAADASHRPPSIGDVAVAKAPAEARGGNETAVRPAADAGSDAANAPVTDAARSAAEGATVGTPGGEALVPVRIEHGDTLTYIVRRYYGRETPALITAVLRANPSITDPDVVLVGQMVLLPGLATKSNGEPDPAALRAESASGSTTSKRKR